MASQRRHTSCRPRRSTFRRRLYSPTGRARNDMRPRSSRTTVSRETQALFQGHARQRSGTVSGERGRAKCRGRRSNGDPQSRGGNNAGGSNCAGEAVMATQPQSFLTPETVPRNRTEGRILRVNTATARCLRWRGASLAHAVLIANLIGELQQALRPRGCRILPSGMRVRVGATGLYTYPDAIALCGEPELADDHFDVLLNPDLSIIARLSRFAPICWSRPISSTWICIHANWIGSGF